MKRNTEQKKIILEELRKRKDHPKADEVYLAVKEKLPNISLGTVYRNLENFKKEGKVTKIEENKFSRFDGNPNNHPHFFCQNCKRVVDLDGDFLDFNISALEKKGFQVDNVGIRVHGFCKNCKKMKGGNK